MLFPTVLVVGVIDGWRRNRAATGLLLLAAVLPIAVYLLTGRRLVAVRFFVPFMVGYLVLLGNGLASMRPGVRTVATLALVVLCAVPLTHFYGTFQWSYDHRAVARTIRERWRPGDVLLFVHPYEALYYRWYLGADVPAVGLVFTALEDQGTYVIKPPDLQFDLARRHILEAAARYERMWVIGQSPRSFASDPAEEQRVLHWMDGRYSSESVARPPGLGAEPELRLYRALAAPPGGAA